MVRTKIQLTDDQVSRLRHIAKAQGVSLAEVIRRYVDRGLSEEGLDEKWRRALAVAGSMRDKEGATDVAERHDDYLDEIYGS